MSIGKKLIAYVMSVVMVVGMIPMSAVAAEQTEHTHVWGAVKYRWEYKDVESWNSLENDDDWISHADAEKRCVAYEECTGEGCDAKNDKATAEVSESGEPDETYEATCTREGQKTYVATFNDANYPNQEYLVTIPQNSDKHTCDEWNEKIPATCIQDGKRGYYHCEECDKYFDADKNEITDLTIAATGHGLTAIQEIPATCTVEGQKAYWQCNSCKQMFGSAIGMDADKISAPIKISKLNHKLSKTPAKPATCTASGNKEYYTCGMCHAHFADNGGRTGIAQNSWIINAKGHSIASRVDKKPTDKKEGSIVKGCGVCGYVEDRLVIPKKKLTLNLGKSAKLVSNARGCTFTLANAKKYGKYFKVDEKTGKVTTKKDYSTKIKKSIPIKVTVGGQTYTVTAKIKIPAPSVKITRKKAGDRYRYTFKYNIPKADKIKVRSNLKGMNTKVVDKYLSQPKSNADSYINLDLGKMKKVKFKIVAYYGKNVSETRVITK